MGGRAARAIALGATVLAAVKRLSEGTAGTIYVCRGAKSKTVPFHS
jgi:hypothetical protein